MQLIPILHIFKLGERPYITRIANVFLCINHQITHKESFVHVFRSATHTAALVLTTTVFYFFGFGFASTVQLLHLDFLEPPLNIHFTNFSLFSSLSLSCCCCVNVLLCLLATASIAMQLER